VTPLSDLSFLTATADADVLVADVDGGGLPDVVQAVLRADGAPEHRTHPPRGFKPRTRRTGQLAVS